MWEISLSHQALSILLSALMGMIFCLLFDTIKAVRIFLRLKTIGTFITDVLFFVLAAVIEFCFFLSRSNGEIRGFILATELIFFFCARWTISRLYLKLLLILFGVLKKTITYINKYFYKSAYKADFFAKKIYKMPLFSRKKG